MGKGWSDGDGEISGKKNGLKMIKMIKVQLQDHANYITKGRTAESST